MITKLQVQSNIRQIREELENRYKYGTIKMAAEDGTSITNKQLQEKMFQLIYKLSKME